MCVGIETILASSNLHCRLRTPVPSHPMAWQNTCCSPTPFVIVSLHTVFPPGAMNLAWGKNIGTKIHAGAVEEEQWSGWD